MSVSEQGPGSFPECVRNGSAACDEAADKPQGVIDQSVTLNQKYCFFPSACAQPPLH